MTAREAAAVAKITRKTAVNMSEQGKYPPLTLLRRLHRADEGLRQVQVMQCDNCGLNASSCQCSVNPPLGRSGSLQWSV